MKWFANKDIEIVEIEGKLYALSGWNGESYGHCWECIDKYNAAPGNDEYDIKPIYEPDENEDGCFDIIGYEIRH